MPVWVTKSRRAGQHEYPLDEVNTKRDDRISTEGPKSEAYVGTQI